MPKNLHSTVTAAIPSSVLTVCIEGKTLKINSGYGDHLYSLKVQPVKVAPIKKEKNTSLQITHRQTHKHIAIPNIVTVENPICTEITFFFLSGIMYKSLGSILQSVFLLSKKKVQTGFLLRIFTKKMPITYTLKFN